MGRGKRRTAHNHLTRDIKAPGKCPKCDEYHARHEHDAAEETATEERFRLEPRFRTPSRYDSRNEDTKVRDGYLLTDLVTGTAQVYPRKKDASADIERVLKREQEIDWTRVAHWSVWLGSSHFGVVEVSGHDAKGERLGQIGLVGRSRDDNETRANVERWLTVMGHAEVSELSRPG